MADDKKNPKEASNIFHSIMKASVKVDNNSEMGLLLKDEKCLLDEISEVESDLETLRSELADVRNKINNLKK